MTTINNFISILTKNFSFYITLLLILSFLNIDFYYHSHYNLDVLPYLSTSEIISLSVFSIGHLSIGSFVAWTAYALVTSWGLFRSSAFKSKIDFENDLITAPFVIFLYPLMIVISNLTITRYSDLYPSDFLLSQFTNFNIIPYSTLYIAALALSTSFIIAIPEIIRAIRKFPLKIWQFPISTYIFIFIALQFAAQVAASTKREGFEIKKYYKYMGTIVETESDTIVSDSTFTYIGRTASSIFMYDIKHNNVKAISSETVKSLKVIAKEKVDRMIGINIL